MSQENVEVVRRGNALLNAGDLDAAIELYHPEVQVRDLQHAPDVAEVVQGIDAFRLLAAQWTEVYSELRAEVYEYIDAGAWVICDTRWHGKVRGSDYPIDIRVADAYEVTAGKIVRAIMSYSDVATALQAVGLKD